MILTLALFILPVALAASLGTGTLTKRANSTGRNEPWGRITPTDNLVWHPATPSPQVPLDYSDPKGRKAAIALIRKPPTNKENYRGPVFFNPGGPGGSGVDLIQSIGDALSIILGNGFDIVLFDPRGIARSTPRASHFDTDIERALFAAEAGSFPVVSNSTVSGIQRTWAQAQLLASLAASHDDGYLQHINTANTATGIVEAYGEEKLQYWGFSYGSMLGSTFAAMYLDKVQGLVIDGVGDSNDYYSAAWLNNMVDSEKTLQLFFDHCAEGGPVKCPFYSPNPADIKRNLTALYERLQVEPVVVNANTLYGVIDYTLVCSLVFSSLYTPYDSFKPLADALAQLAAGNGTAVLSLRPPQVPKCSSDPHEHDWERVDEGFTTKKLLEVTEFADVWGQLHASCANWPKGKRLFRGPFIGNTSYPMPVIVNTAGACFAPRSLSVSLAHISALDPVTPLRYAEKIAKGFKDSVVLNIDAGGHCSLNAPSICALQYVRQYFQNGTLPEPDTVCEPTSKNPFLPPPADKGEVARRAIKCVGGEKAELRSALTQLSKLQSRFSPFSKRNRL
ncbi:alpha/beta-hydrolase [Coprinellus micaceus]|uniref:Alpha/beta-hydrolase n=1 Tax=Coprinellus micaceus TaxID=71717 RepID=A0A4Y7TMN4_COPMI|nr:alpha/beta-hydrolase [Coprinellus micaceus]